MFWLVRSLLMLILAPHVVALEVACTRNVNVLEVTIPRRGKSWLGFLIFFIRWKQERIIWKKQTWKKYSLEETPFSSKPSFSFLLWLDPRQSKQVSHCETKRHRPLACRKYGSRSWCWFRPGSATLWRGLRMWWPSMVNSNQGPQFLQKLTAMKISTAIASCQQPWFV